VHRPVVICWYNGPSSTERQFGGEYHFEASDDLAAIEHAHSDFDESISLADQSPVIDEMGRVVWENEPPKR
jgi:hypothetical protein